MTPPSTEARFRALALAQRIGIEIDQVDHRIAAVESGRLLPVDAAVQTLKAHRAIYTELQGLLVLLVSQDG